MSKEAMKLALEALESCSGAPHWPALQPVITALREALAEQPAPVVPVQEPWAWLFQHEETGLTQCVDTQQVEWGFEKNNPRWQKIAPLYTSPQAPKENT